jgi:hypothetical protein
LFPFILFQKGFNIMAAKTVRAISVKTVGVNPKDIFKLADDVKAMHAVKILGRVTGVLTDERPDGTMFDVLTGNFEATNKDGEVYASGRCFLPIGFDEGIINSIKGKENAPEIQFAVSVDVIRANNAQGYSYSMETLFEEERTPETDPLHALRVKVAAAPALAAPKKDEAPAAEVHAEEKASKKK